MIYFIGAGSGDIELLTLKAINILKKADIVLYTGSLVPKEILLYCKKNTIIKDSQHLKYNEIFELFLKHKDKLFARVHTGDPSLFSTIAKQIKFLKQNSIEYKIIPGVSAAFGAAASLEIEYTIPGISQTLVLSRIEGKTPNPQKLKEILLLKNSSLVFYLSINLIKTLKKEALALGYKKTTPCWVIHKATWDDERVFKSTINDIEKEVTEIKGIALILFGEFLNQEENIVSSLYTKPLLKTNL